MSLLTIGAGRACLAIVFGCLVKIAFAAEQPLAELVVLNAAVRTMEAQAPSAEAFAVQSGRFVRVGTAAEVRAFIGAKTQVVDAAGRTVLPGFNDAHIHPGPVFSEDSPLGRVPCGPNSVATIEELVERLRAKAALTPPGQWVKGERYQDTKLGRHPTRQDLDQVSKVHPVSISHSSGHVAVVNSFALRLANVDQQTPDPRGGQFDRDAAGAPNGILRESAKGVVFSAGPNEPEPSTEEWISGIHRQFERYLEHGITSIQIAGTDPETLDLYRKAQVKKRQVRIYAMLRREHVDELRALIASSGGQRGDEWLKVGAIKMFHGNSLSGQTCWLYEPYEGRPDYYGIPPAASQAELNRQVLEIHQAGLQVCIHSNGDREIDMVLNAYEEALKTSPRTDHRHRIEHASICNAKILERVKSLGVVLALHSYVWEHGDKMEVYGPQRWPWMHPASAALSRGIWVAGNSDSPVSSAIPLLQIQSMVTRESAEGKVYGREQIISLDQAIHAWTLGSAYASFDDQEKGSITPGKLADFVVLADDPTCAPPQKLKDIQVDLTFVEGKVAYDARGDIAN